jgi:hypothetical protein
MYEKRSWNAFRTQFLGNPSFFSTVGKPQDDMISADRKSLMLDLSSSEAFGFAALKVS